jgi:hypothetical protein
MALAPPLTQGSSLRRAPAGRLALWALQIGLAGMFLLAGSSSSSARPRWWSCSTLSASASGSAISQA